MNRPFLKVLALAGLAAALVVTGVRESRRRALVGDGSLLQESCLACHRGPEASPGGPHAPEAVGCAACHLGDPLAYDMDRAHRRLEREPGALDTVDRTCGRQDCHAEQTRRVRAGLMASARGIVSVDRFALGLQQAPDGSLSMGEVLDREPVDAGDVHLRRLCGGCHLGTRRANRDDAVQGVGSGCGACHYDARPVGWRGPHGPVDARIPDRRCLGCHSRSARISLSYAGLAEVRPGDPAADTVTFDGRPARRMPPDRHHEAGMRCTDCHTHRDLMGDGVPWLHQEEAVEVACTDCHPARGEEPVETIWALVQDEGVRGLLRRRDQERPLGEPVRLTRGGTPIWNLRPSFALPAGDRATTSWTLVRKADGRPLPLRRTPDDASHRRHGILACQACHAAWIPWCADCHTGFVDDGTQWDFGVGAVGPGRMVETARRFETRPPALAVRWGRLAPAAPGMAMEMDLSALGGPAGQSRLLASFDPHTTGRRARPCADCHPSHEALGSALALDPSFRGTRLGLGPLDPGTRSRLVAVGRCLPCHPGGALVTAKGLDRSAGTE